MLDPDIAISFGECHNYRVIADFWIIPWAARHAHVCREFIGDEGFSNGRCGARIQSNAIDAVTPFMLAEPVAEISFGR